MLVYTGAEHLTDLVLGVRVALASVLIPFLTTDGTTRNDTWCTCSALHDVSLGFEAAIPHSRRPA
jgi:hypothetical protein